MRNRRELARERRELTRAMRDAPSQSMERDLFEILTRN